MAEFILRSPYLLSLGFIILLFLVSYFSPLNQNRSLESLKPSSHQKKLTTKVPLPEILLRHRLRHRKGLSQIISLSFPSRIRVVRRGLKKTCLEQEQQYTKPLLQRIIHLTERRFTSLEDPFTETLMHSIKSHIEMVKRFKIWANREGDLPMIHNGPTTYINSIEGRFIFEIEGGPYPFMAKDLDEAHTFFLPIRVSKITDYQYRPHEETSHRLVHVFADHVYVVANKYPYWNRSSRVDHFFVSCHDWVLYDCLAPRITRYHHQDLYKNFIKVLCNANTFKGFKPSRDVSLPEYNLRAFQLGPPRFGLPPDKLPIPAFFTGAVHRNTRNILFKHWKGKDDEVLVYGELSKKNNYHQLMGQAKFCLCLNESRSCKS